MQTINAIQMAHIILLEKVKTANILVDATAGNGGDTAFLAMYAKDDARIFAFDIQKSALENTEDKLNELHLIHKVQLILDSHAKLEKYVEGSVDVAMFNLGYLPGGMRELTTLAESTLCAVNSCIEKLSVNGTISIVAYPGHTEGRIECENLHAMLKFLPQNEFIVGYYKMMNHTAIAPVLYLIEKVRG